MYMRIATFDQKPDIDPERHAEFLRWMGEQPGMVGGWHGLDPQTGKVVSVSVWKTKDDLLAMKDRVYPKGPLGLKPSGVVIYEVTNAFGPAAR
jgi:hypothetical protein